MITSKEECLEVNRNFVETLRYEINQYDQLTCGYNGKLLSWFDTNVTIAIKRVDVAFTHYMKELETFSSYRNIYMVLNRIYSFFNKNSIPKNIGVLSTGEMETLIFANTANVGAYNQKVTIYNQYNKFQDYYANTNPELLNRTLEEFPDLEQRMRIETCKRIKRKGFTVYEFENFDIFSAYVPPFAEYALTNLFNMEALESVYRERIEQLKALLVTERACSNFTYQNFIYKYINEIWDYDMIRLAVMESTSNSNSGYQACSTIKEVLEQCQYQTGIIYFGVKKKIQEISKTLIKQMGRR